MPDRAYRSTHTGSHTPECRPRGLKSCSATIVDPRTQVPGVGASLHRVGEALWYFNIALFTLFVGLYTARWTMFGHEARRIFGHNTVSMFIGTIPMSLATIINGFLAFGLPEALPAEPADEGEQFPAEPPSQHR